MKKNINYGRQFIDNYDVNEVSRSLKKDLITTGDYVKKLLGCNFSFSNFAIFKNKSFKLSK